MTGELIKWLFFYFKRNIYIYIIRVPCTCEIFLIAAKISISQSELRRDHGNYIYYLENILGADSESTRAAFFKAFRIVFQRHNFFDKQHLAGFTLGYISDVVPLR